MLEQVKSLSDKGLATQQRLLDSQILLTSADRDAQYAIANIARSRDGLERAARDLAMLTLERKATVEKELQTTDDRLAKLGLTIDVADKVIGIITRRPTLLASDDREPQYRFELLRKGDDGERQAGERDREAAAWRRAASKRRTDQGARGRLSSNLHSHR